MSTSAAPAATSGDRVRRLTRFAGGWLLVVAAVVLTAMLLWRTAEGHGLTQLTDFRIFRAAGDAVLRGATPYPQPTVDAMRGQSVFVYPAPAAALFTALAAAPFTVSWVLWLAGMCGALLLALRLAGMRHPAGLAVS